MLALIRWGLWGAIPCFNPIQYSNMGDWEKVRHYQCGDVPVCNEVVKIHPVERIAEAPNTGTAGEV